MEKFKNIKDEEEEEIVENLMRERIFGKEIPSIFVLYAMRKIWRPLLLASDFKNKI